MTPVQAIALASLRQQYERAERRWENFKPTMVAAVNFERQLYDEKEELGRQLERAIAEGVRPKGFLPRQQQGDRPQDLQQCTCETYVDGDHDPACPVHSSGEHQ